MYFGVRLPQYSNQEWRKHFRMSKDTLEYIATELQPLLRKQTTRFGHPIHYRKRLAAVIWWLATPTEYRSLASKFGIGISTLCGLTRRVCHAIKQTFMHRYISLLSGNRLIDTVEGLPVQRRGFPQCAGVIDGTHLPVIAPHESPVDYHNRKGWHSMILQADVDHNYCFTDIYIGWPGRTHDARVLANSDLFAKADHRGIGFLFPEENNIVINGTKVPVVLIGDPAYPLKKWLMKGFPNNGHLTPAQTRFNFQLSSARMVVENAFGRLKGRWRRLLKRNDVSISFASDVAATCCILRNICEIHKERYDPQWHEGRRAEEEEGGMEQPRDSNEPTQHDVRASAIRDTIMESL